MKYAIKYLRFRYNAEIDILIPKKLIVGEVKDGIYFETDKEILPYITNEEAEGKYVVGEAQPIEQLRKLYGGSPTDTDDDVINLFFMDQQDKMPIIKNGLRKTLDTFEMFDDNGDEKTIYQYIDGESSIIFNKRILEKLQRVEDMETVRQIFAEYSDRLASFDERRAVEEIDSIFVTNGHETIVKAKPNQSSSTPNTPISTDVSVRGLYEHLKANIMGHDKELKAISTVMLMNYLSNPYFGTESILVPGPTGTGKTATFKCVASYFNLPFRDINTINLVPEGIVGTTLEDVFSSIIDECGGDIARAERAILAFDEFDKLSSNGVENKETLRYIFLKALEGASFPINRQLRETRVYNTSMASKVALGAFEQAFKKDNKTIGFATATEETIPVFDRKLLVEKGYFNDELLSRFQHFIPYGEISDADKKRVILESKLSTYMLKKERLESQFNITVEGDEEYALGVMAALRQVDQSMRDINNIIARSFLDIQYEILDGNGRYKRLVLTRDTVSGGKFDLS